MNTNKTISKEENMRRCFKWADICKKNNDKAGELVWLQRAIEWEQGKLKGEEPMPDVIVKLEGRPKRDTVISNDEILDLRIALERNEI